MLAVEMVENTEFSKVSSDSDVVVEEFEAGREGCSNDWTVELWEVVVVPGASDIAHSHLMGH